MHEIIAVDISGRHKINGEYFMVVAAVSAFISANNIEKINEIKIKTFKKIHAPELTDVVKMVEDTVNELQSNGIIITEKGDMYNVPEKISSSMFSRAFKYQESIGERNAIELAHHVSFSARNLLLKELGMKEQVK